MIGRYFCWRPASFAPSFSEAVQPTGDIGALETTLIPLALGSMLLVVMPVIIFAWR
jgi:hypothetical protein